MKSIRSAIITACFMLVIVTIAVSSDEAALPKPELTVKQIMQGQDFVGHWPNNLFWSEDSRNVYFSWNPENSEGDSLYVVSLDALKPIKVNFNDRLELPSRYGAYDKNYKRMVYSKNSDIFILDIEKNIKTQLTNTLKGVYNLSFNASGDKIIYEEDGNLFSRIIKNGRIQQLTDFKSGMKRSEDERPSSATHEGWLENQQQELFETLRMKKIKKEQRTEAQKATKPKRPLEIYTGKNRVNYIQLSPDENYVTFGLRKEANKTRSTIVPQYLTDDGFTKDISARSKVGRDGASYQFGIYNIRQDTVYYIETDSVPGIFDQPKYYEDYKQPSDSTEDPKKREVYFRGPYFSDDGAKAVIAILSMDNKDRWIMSLDPANAKLKLIDHQHDEAWIGGPGISGWWGSDIGWLSDNRTIYFQSETTGYSHLYTYDITTNKKTELTSGNYEIHSLKISRDKKHFYFISNEIHPGEQQFYRMNIDGSQKLRITSESGGNRIYISPDEKKLAILHCTSNKPPELYLMDNKPGADMMKITSSLSDDFQSYPWRKPEVVTLKARDDALVHARIYLPDNFEPGAPVVFFVHGAGYLQNAHKRWSSYYREYMFHNLLADKGYVVCDIDYRGSAGYGRNWRTGIYRHMGGKDLDDYVDAIRFLSEEYKVDTTNVGIYGGSYGGFLTLMAMFTQPDKFHAGAALRSVTDWAHYNHGYTSNILNVPHLDSLAYALSSPINFAEGLNGSLLMCHGMLDVNVHYQDIIRLTQRLIELGKSNWELASYPLEGHSFREASSWIDEYSRILKLFEQTLKH